jgi:hypothetical protein
LVVTTDKYSQKYKDLTNQSNLAHFGFVSFCPIPWQTKLDTYFPKNNPILEILLAYVKESEILDKTSLRFKTAQNDPYPNKKARIKEGGLTK